MGFLEFFHRVCRGGAVGAGDFSGIHAQLLQPLLQIHHLLAHLAAVELAHFAVGQGVDGDLLALAVDGLALENQLEHLGGGDGILADIVCFLEGFQGRGGGSVKGAVGGLVQEAQLFERALKHSHVLACVAGLEVRIILLRVSVCFQGFARRVLGRHVGVFAHDKTRSAFISDFQEIARDAQHRDLRALGHGGDALGGGGRRPAQVYGSGGVGGEGEGGRRAGGHRGGYRRGRGGSFDRLGGQRLAGIEQGQGHHVGGAGLAQVVLFLERFDSGDGAAAGRSVGAAGIVSQLLEAHLQLHHRRADAVLLDFRAGHGRNGLDLGGLALAVFGLALVQQGLGARVGAAGLAEAVLRLEGRHGAAGTGAEFAVRLAAVKAQLLQGALQRCDRVALAAGIQYFIGARPRFFRRGRDGGQADAAVHYAEILLEGIALLALVGNDIIIAAFPGDERHVPGGDGEHHLGGSGGLLPQIQVGGDVARQGIDFRHGGQHAQAAYQCQQQSRGTAQKECTHCSSSTRQCIHSSWIRRTNVPRAYKEPSLFYFISVTVSRYLFHNYVIFTIVYYKILSI